MTKLDTILDMPKRKTKDIASKNTDASYVGKRVQ